MRRLGQRMIKPSIFDEAIRGESGKVGEICLVSEVFAELTSEATRPVGEFELKGMAQAQTVYAPAAVTTKA